MLFLKGTAYYHYVYFMMCHIEFHLVRYSWSLTLSQHPHSTALPQPTVLALPPHVHVHLTAAPTLTVIHSFFSHTTPEETYTIQVKEGTEGPGCRLLHYLSENRHIIQYYRENGKVAKCKTEIPLHPSQVRAL